MEADIIADLRSKLKEAEKERLTAAQYGLQLLESQNELQNQLDKYRNEMMAMTENYEQEKYALQREVELKSRMLESLNCECEAIKQQQKVQLEQLEEQLSRSHGQEMNEIKNKLEKLKAELDEARLSEKQLKHKVDHQKELLAHKSEEIRIMSERVHESMSSEMLALQIELTEMSSTKTTLTEEVNERRYRQEQLESLSNNLMRQVNQLKEEKEEREKEAVSYYNALQKARVENQDLQVQLNQALQQALDPNSKGNSLFAEVEDRRAAMERQLISMKVKYQSLKKQNAFNREQMQRMKNLCMESKPSIPGNSGVLEDKTYYTDLLQLKLDNLNKENESTKGELSIQRMKALFESQRALEIERKLFANERRLQLSESENMKLRAKVDELKLKYEPEEKTEVPVLKKRREVLPVDVTVHKDSCANSADGDEVSRFPPQKVEAQSSPNNAEDTNLQLEEPVSVNTPTASFSPRKNLPVDMQPKKEKKCVRLIDDPADAEALCGRSGNAPCSPRLTAEAQLQTEAKEGKEAASKLEKEPGKKSHPILYVSSKSAPETQCPQQ
ncbi:PREDICTED: protein Spindly isoform X2 [Chinchilla lanigera]|uniref:protein Spindly isoform X2 n=1 Tax=Chinchilla lanigera TaxID=34839 RepID=UPI00038EA50E|nr:PREDICTED: protein Spindly isoform X2 [Chinchilla lanigera]